MRALLLSLLLLLSACAQPLIVVPQPNRADNEARMLGAVQRLGQPGDWLVIRGYHATDHAVSLATNSPFSHVALLDPERWQVIEAEGRGVHTTELANFTPKAQRLLLLRPQWASTPERQQAAVEQARRLMGRPYDFLGLVGLNVSDAYYCSELAVAVYAPHASRQDYLPPIIAPGQMLNWGTVIWDSGPTARPSQPGL